MNTLLRDRNTLKRLVESYGKQDVLNYVKHLNEAVDPALMNVINDSRLDEISYEEAVNKLKFNWITVGGQLIKSFPKKKRYCIFN